MLMINYKNYEYIVKYLDNKSVFKMFYTKVIKIRDDKNIYHSNYGSKIRKYINGSWVDYIVNEIKLDKIEKHLIKLGYIFNEKNNIKNRFMPKKKLYYFDYKKKFIEIRDKLLIIIKEFEDIKIKQIDGEYQEFNECIVTYKGDFEYRVSKYIICNCEITDNNGKFIDVVILNVGQETDQIELEKDIRYKIMKLVIINKTNRFDKDVIVKEIGQDITCIARPRFSSRLVHESIGHYSEIDFFEKEEFNKKILGKKICSDEITVIDYAKGENIPNNYYIDEEGTETKDTYIIKKGFYIGVLTAENCNNNTYCEIRGSVRSYEDLQNSLVRMRNTALLNGNSSSEEIYKNMKNGIIVDEYIDGNTNCDGDFFVQAKNAIVIKNYEIIGVIDKIDLYGNVYTFLKSISMIGKDFKWYENLWCDKENEKVKVSCGAPTIKCKLNIVL